MAGRGPAPKHHSVRARRNKADVRTLRAVDSAQPELPAEIPWPDATRRWWDMWASSPQADQFGPTDWDFLIDTALIHADVWSGNLDRLNELRIRVAKFGATPEDRARLKMQYAEAEIAEDRASERRERRERTAASGKGGGKAKADPRAALSVVS